MLMDIIRTQITSIAKRIYTMVHLFSLSVREFTAMFQVPKQKTSHLALLTDLNEHETNSPIQTRAMSLVGIPRSLLCFVGALAAANILLHMKKRKHSLLKNMLSH